MYTKGTKKLLLHNISEEKLREKEMTCSSGRAAVLQRGDSGVDYTERSGCFPIGAGRMLPLHPVGKRRTVQLVCSSHW